MEIKNDNVLVSFNESLATVTLNRPDRKNAITGPLNEELAAAFENATVQLGDDGKTWGYYISTMAKDENGEPLLGEDKKPYYEDKFYSDADLRKILDENTLDTTIEDGIFAS